MNEEKAVETNSEKKKPMPIKKVVKVSELQRMHVEELQEYARSVGLKNLGSYTKSQIVFEIVKTISAKPEEVLYGEGVFRSVA